MGLFTQKLRVIYRKLFNENIDEFTKALIDYKKFKREKFEGMSEKEAKNQFFLNRKTVLRRWLQQGSRCTSDFQKSYYHYALSSYQLNAQRLFTLEDFKDEKNLIWFDQHIEKFIEHQQRVEAQTTYQFIYIYCDTKSQIDCFEIKNWEKGENKKVNIELKKEDEFFVGNFQRTNESNILIELKLKNNPLYLLFHDNNDKSLNYLVGVSMGFLPNDNKVPRSQKVVFSKKQLNTEQLDISFMLNESENIVTLENRINGNMQEEIHNYFLTPTNRFKKFTKFFKRLQKRFYKDSFYHRLAFQEFYSVKSIFKKITKNENYYIIDFQHAFLELLNTVENIKELELNIVMQLNSNNLLLKSGRKDLEIKNKILNLHKHYGIKTTIIFVIESNKQIDTQSEYLFRNLALHNVEVRVIEEKVISHKVDSLDFSFMHLGDHRDFVLADPIRDSKDVYKIFIDELTMDEYRSSYTSFLAKSKVYNGTN